MKPSSEIAILDFGSQYTHLIARRVRELGVKSHIYSNDIPADSLNNALGIILSGGPKSIVRDAKLEYDPKLFDLNIPILGLCYGHQLMAEHFGGKVESGQAREYGLATLSVSLPHRQAGSFQFPVSENNKSNETINSNPSAIFKNIPLNSTVWMSHGDHVAQLPTGFKQIGQSGSSSITAMANEEKKFYGFQFHPEVSHTEFGAQMLTNFIFNICGAEKNWTTEKMLEQIENAIKSEVGNKNVFLLVSGGVDSAVCFALLEKVLGKNRVYGLHIDNGLMRLNESAQVKQALEKIGFDNLHSMDASEEFLTALQNVSEPETKRQIIGNLFIKVVERKMKELNFSPDQWLFGQGTIYPDTIESGGTKNADKIKTHHNRVAQIQTMIDQGLVIEPIKELYKDEVREIGLKLGLPPEMVNRHPFPGPGLAIRCLCSTGSSDAPTLQHFNTF